MVTLARVRHVILPPVARLSPFPCHLVRNYVWLDRKLLHAADSVPTAFHSGE
jgi:hypothetical protein